MRWLAPLFAAVLFAACVAASASEPKVSVLVSADSVILVYVATPPAEADDSIVHRAFFGSTYTPGDSTNREARAANDSAGRTVRFAWPRALWTPNVPKGGQACSAMVKVNPEGGASIEGAGTCTAWSFTRDLAAPAAPTAVSVVSVGYN